MTLVQIDFDDPTDAWHSAIDLWARGKRGHVHLLLDGERPIPTFARQWLMLALEGKEPRKRGRPATEPTARQAMMLFALFDWAPDGKQLPRNRTGYTKAAKIIGAEPREVERWLPRTRANRRGGPSAPDTAGIDLQAAWNTRKAP